MMNSKISGHIVIMEPSFFFTILEINYKYNHFQQTFFQLYEYLYYNFLLKVTRTQDRPLASGELSYFQALSFLGLQLSGALAILLTFNWYT